MLSVSVDSFYHFSKDYKAAFGGEVVIKGFPTASRNGSTIYTPAGLAIAENSPNKADAWSFISTFLSEEYQNSDANIFGFPTNRAVFDMRIQDALDGFGGGWTEIDGVKSPISDDELVPQDDIDQVLS